MTGEILGPVFRVAAVALACAGIGSYVAYRSPRSVDYATEQRDGSEHRVVKRPAVRIGEFFTAFDVPPASAPFEGSWPGFRGARRDNLVHDNVALQKSWGPEGPRVRWRKELGEGYAGAMVAAGRLYVLDYSEEDNADALRCFDPLTGEEFWRRSYANPIRRNHGKSRTVPAYADGVVVSLGPAGHLMAVDAATGALRWTRDLVEAYRCEIPQWYAGQCPLIEDGKVILGLGGADVLMAALDLHTGDTIWEMPNDAGLNMSHASVLSTTLSGQAQYVYAGIGGLAACDREGRPLWTCTAWKPAVWAPTPVKIADDRLFLTAGYGAGGALLSVRAHDDGRWVATLENEWKPTRGPASEQQTPLVIDDTLFIIQPKDAGALRGELVAADVRSIPEIKASSGREARFGLGPYLYADGAFWIADDEGVLHVYAFQNQQFVRLARHKVLPGVDAWGPIAYAEGHLWLRDSTSLVCLDLRKEDRP